MTKSESKYFNTALKMDEAFLSLLEKKDFEYITVKEICKKAGVNRSTFYLHYVTVGDLVTECTERMNKEFFSYFSSSSAEFLNSIESASLQQLYLITPEYLTPYLTFISEHKTLFRVVLTKPETLQVSKTYVTLFFPVINKILERYSVPENERSYLMDFYIEGLMGIVKRWLGSDCKDSIEHITEIMVKVVNGKYGQTER